MSRSLIFVIVAAYEGRYPLSVKNYPFYYNEWINTKKRDDATEKRSTTVHFEYSLVTALILTSYLSTRIVVIDHSIDSPLNEVYKFLARHRDRKGVCVF